MCGHLGAAQLSLRKTRVGDGISACKSRLLRAKSCGAGEIGVDLGLSTLATLSDGRKIENPRHFKKHKSAYDPLGL